MQDGSIFLNVVKLRQLLGPEFKLEIDINDDVFAMAAIQHWARHHGSKRLAVDPGRRRPQELHAAGGAAARPDPRRPHRWLRHRRAVLRRPGGQRRLSSCPASEGHTWGKVSIECVEESSVYVHSDVTAVFPWLVHALFSEKVSRRKPKRIMDHLGEAVDYLEVDVAKRRRSLMKTLHFPGV